MKRRRNLLVALLLVCAMGIGVGYAAVTTNMTINGTAVLEKIEGQVHFESATLTAGDAVASTKTIEWKDAEPTVGTAIKNLEFSIKGFDVAGETATVKAAIRNPHDFAVAIKDVTTTTAFDAEDVNETVYFSFTDDLDGDEIIAAGDKLDVTITITCNATNATDAAIEDQFVVSFKAEACADPTP